MKTTVKLSQSLSATVQPCKGTGGILLEITHGAPFAAQSSEAFHFTPDQWGALMAGGSFAIETMQATV